MEAAEAAPLVESKHLHMTAGLLDFPAVAFYTQRMITAYILGLLATTSLLMAWFMSGMPYHVLDLLSKVSFRADLILRTALDLMHKDTTFDMNTAVTLAATAHPKWVNLLVELFGCRICLSFHASFWVSVVMTICGSLPWYFVPAATLSWPYLSNYLLSQLKH